MWLHSESFPRSLCAVIPVNNGNSPSEEVAWKGARGKKLHHPLLPLREAVNWSLRLFFVTKIVLTSGKTLKISQPWKTTWRAMFRQREGWES